MRSLKLGQLRRGRILSRSLGLVVGAVIVVWAVAAPAYAATTAVITVTKSAGVITLDPVSSTLSAGDVAHWTVCVTGQGGCADWTTGATAQRTHVAVVTCRFESSVWWEYRLENPAGTVQSRDRGYTDCVSGDRVADFSHETGTATVAGTVTAIPTGTQTVAGTVSANGNVAVTNTPTVAIAGGATVAGTVEIANEGQPVQAIYAGFGLLVFFAAGSFVYSMRRRG